VITSDDSIPSGAQSHAADVPDSALDDDAPATGRLDKEWVVSDERSVRRGAWILGSLLLVGSVVWARSAVLLFNPPDDVCEGCAPDWFRWSQLLLSLVGIALALVAVAYVVNVARSGRTWNKRRRVTTTLAVVVAAWVILVLGGRVFL
jgi:hypothetical protein